MTAAVLDHLLLPARFPHPSATLKETPLEIRSALSASAKTIPLPTFHGAF